MTARTEVKKREIKAQNWESQYHILFFEHTNKSNKTLGKWHMVAAGNVQETFEKKIQVYSCAELKA